MNITTFMRFVNDFVAELRDLAPKDTGNLANNAIRFEYKGNDAIIYVNQDIAYYMPYTNEPWISPKWNGKKNPNEAWWNKAVDEIVHKLAKKYKGRVE